MMFARVALKPAADRTREGAHKLSSSAFMSLALARHNCPHQCSSFWNADCLLDLAEVVELADIDLDAPYLVEGRRT